jgi:uncharacterized membrane protein HdeD (DUF308 family)
MSKNTLVLVGAILAVLGVLAIAVPYFTTTETKDIAKIGDLKVQAKTEETHAIPPFVGPAALILGVVVLGAGLMQRR